MIIAGIKHDSMSNTI